MKIVCISDTHTKHRQIEIPDGDVLVFAGDLMSSGYSAKEVVDFSVWLSELPHKHKVIIAGNHDRLAELNPQPFRDELKEVAIYLEDSGTEIDGIKFWGSPYTPEFGTWAFNAPRDGSIKKHWDKIPMDTDVLITHGPPYGILDKTGGLLYKSPGVWEDMSLGCHYLAERVKEIKPVLHIFGHIHGGYGQEIANETLHINASVLSEGYQLKNEPYVIDI